jgi:hypothetical protein
MIYSKLYKLYGFLSKASNLAISRNGSNYTIHQRKINGVVKVREKLTNKSFIGELFVTSNKAEKFSISYKS